MAEADCTTSTLNRLWRRAKGLPPWPRGGFVLAYHRIASPDRDPHRLAVSPGRFAEHLDVLRDQAEPFALETMVERAQRGTLPSNAVAITFDDGYVDNLHAAAPLLDRARVPATVFVSTGAIRCGERFWWDRQDTSESDSGRPLTPAEVTELAGFDRISIGSHTVSHSSLAQLSDDEQRAEIAGANRDLESWIGRRVSAFAYPFGGDADMPASTKAILRDEQIAVACSTRPGSVRADVDPLQVPRIVIPNWTGAEFLRYWMRWSAAR